MCALGKGLSLSVQCFVPDDAAETASANGTDTGTISGVDVKTQEKPHIPPARATSGRARWQLRGAANIP